MFVWTSLVGDLQVLKLGNVGMSMRELVLQNLEKAMALAQGTCALPSGLISLP